MRTEGTLTTTTTTTTRPPARGYAPYAALALVHLIALAGGATALAALSKVALMPVLYLSVKQTTRQPVARWWTAAIALSWLGDIFLLPQAGGRLGISAESAFLLGLASFLLAHICYIRRAGSLRRATATWARRGCAVLAAALFFAALALVPWALVVATPVLPAAAVYAVVLLAMAVTVGRLARERPAYRYAALGAGLFVVSDALIGLGLVRPGLVAAPWRQVAVMATYVLAQAGLSGLAYAPGDPQAGPVVA